MSTCGEVGSDVHALIKELAIRRVENRSKTHSNEPRHLAEGTEVARLRRRFYIVLQQALSFGTRHHLCKQRVALASTRRLRSQGPVSVHAHRPEGITGCEGRGGANGVWGGIGVGGGIGDRNRVGGGNGDVNGDGDGDGAGAGTGTTAGVKANEGAKNGNGDGSGDGAGTGTGTGVETRGRTQNGNGDGNEEGIGEGGGEAKKRKKPHHNCRRDQALLFRTRHHLGRQRVALADTRHLRSEGPVPVHAHRIEGVTGSEGRKGSNGIGTGN